MDMGKGRSRGAIRPQAAGTHEHPQQGPVLRFLVKANLPSSLVDAGRTRDSIPRARLRREAPVVGGGVCQYEQTDSPL